MPPIVTYGESQPVCPKGSCKCGAYQRSELRPELTDAQRGETASRTLTQLTGQGIQNIFTVSDNNGNSAELARKLLEHVTILSGGSVPRIGTDRSGRPYIEYFLNTHGNPSEEDLPILPGVCRRGPMGVIAELLLGAHKAGFIELEPITNDSFEEAFN